MDYLKYNNFDNLLDDFEVNQFDEIKKHSISIDTNSGSETVHIFDNVYKYPEKVREYSLRQSYTRDSLPGIYRLKNNINQWASDSTIPGIQSRFTDIMKYISPSHFQVNPNLCRLIIAKSDIINEPSNVRIHQDLMPNKGFTWSKNTYWQSIIYLNKPQECRGGTCTYKLKVEIPPHEIAKKVDNNKFIIDDYIETSYTKMVPNRLVTYPAHIWHASKIESIDDFKDNHRIVQTFQWRSINKQGDNYAIKTS